MPAPPQGLPPGGNPAGITTTLKDPPSNAVGTAGGIPD